MTDGPGPWSGWPRFIEGGGVVVTYRAGEVYAERSYTSCMGNQAGSARLQHLPPSLVLAPGEIGDMQLPRCHTMPSPSYAMGISEERGSGSGVVLVDQIDDEKTSRCQGLTALPPALPGCLIARDGARRLRAGARGRHDA